MQLDEGGKQRLQQRLGYTPSKASYTFYVATSAGHIDGYAFIDEEKGEHLPITFAVKLSPEGRVLRQEVVVYREARGDEVRDDRFRAQFVGKSARDAIDTNQDIVAVSGATISSRAMARRRQARGRAVRRAGQADGSRHRQPVTGLPEIAAISLQARRERARARRVRQFASSGFRIWNLSREAKLIYTGFGLFSLAAIVVSMLFYEDLVGPRTAGVAGYYAGAAPARSPEPGAPTAGRKIDLPAEATASSEQLTVAVTYRKLLEVTHFHLFTVPVFLLIIAHLFMLTGLSSTAKTAWIAAGWLSAVRASVGAVADPLWRRRVELHLSDLGRAHGAGAVGDDGLPARGHVAAAPAEPQRLIQNMNARPRSTR